MEITTKQHDAKKSVEGVWFDYGTDGAKLLIARAGNRDYNAAFERTLKQYEKKKRPGQFDFPPGEMRKISGRLTAEHILKDWRGITENGVEVPYSQAKAIEWMTSPDMDEFVDDVIAFSEDAERFRTEEVDAAVKK